MKKIVLLIIVIFMVCGCDNKKYNGEINVLNWSSYIPYEVIDDFEKEYNIKVNYGTYSSNEELLAKVSSSSMGTYDLIFPSDYMVELMISKGLLEKFDKIKLNNIDHVNPLFLNQKFDSNNDYSIVSTHIFIFWSNPWDIKHSPYSGWFIFLIVNTLLL